jgi:predicted DNA-binding transcriptional regulator YafY
VEHLPGGHARISFEVTEIGEVVRWALGFGQEARIVSPPEAVEIARQTVSEIVAAYKS